LSLDSTFTVTEFSGCDEPAMRFARLDFDILKRAIPSKFLFHAPLLPRRRVTMEHIQGTLLDPQGQALFEVLVSLETHTLDDTEFWTGYFEPPSASSVISGGTFRLVLDDGRAQDILIEYVEPLSPHASRMLFKTAGLPHPPHSRSNPG
jgi:hypothetical protein